ncbi:kinesin heavy chain-like isoform X1 [Haliotis rufescens]|uniref:kinesin heavy chain-like isoform X1 n=1 Tax=Haliotis rufescens TaxID=6454 RepID=UPI00201F11B8|nr:kinesin heavy chain-like isoform X1 [Haliotis rufescens]
MTHIKTYARLKPSSALYDEYDVTPTTLQIRTPEIFRDYGSPGKFRATVRHEYYFDRVFDVSDTQENVFDGVAREIINGFLNGYNGTMFAYGQTGTGKTYTVEGSARKYSDRGLAPRALSMIYKSLEQRSDEEITAHISYMEIYQEVAYDLLNPGARTFSPVTPLPKVGVAEGAGGSCLLRNLSVHLAASEEVAQSLLLQGQANRRVAETPVNQRSSRSHAVFSIYLTAKRPDSDVIVRSKLHLVDLAGSERVAKTGVDGQQLTEAKSINLSLHHLETVIISLQADSGIDRQRTAHSLRQCNSSSQLSRPYTADDARSPKHVPYRNSLLTMVLRDSLGGNCQTAMIATISLEVQNIGESLSTCRFAQRVACIANHAMRNEEIDDRTLIKRLKKRVAELEAEIAFMRLNKETECTDEMMSSKLTDEDKIHCARVVHEYLGGRLTDPVTAGITDPYKFRECLRLLKKMVLSGYFKSDSSSGSRSSPGKGPRNFNGRTDDNSVQILRIDHDSTDTGNITYDNTDDANTNAVISSPPMKPGQAWGESLMPRTPDFNDRVKKASIGTSPHRPVTADSITSNNSKYTSPYERKREREIHRLSRRINKLQSSYESKENELNDLQHNVELQELEVMESGLKAKVDVTKDQISHQQAYIIQLRDTEADPGLVEQEKLVERQLRKRQAKFEKKIEGIEQRKAHILRKDVESPELPRTPSKVGIEEKFGQYKKRDGSLNTRQVFNMLKQEEKKRQKAQTEIEREKILTVSRQLEVREAATRQKLKELKQMIRQSHDNKEQTDTDLNHDEQNSRRTFHEMKTQVSSTFNGTRLTEECHERGDNLEKKGSRNNGGNAEKNSDKDNQVHSMLNNRISRPVSGKSIQSVTVPDGSFYTQRKTSTGVASRWDSAYSTRPSTAETRPATADTMSIGQSPPDGLSLNSLSQAFNPDLKSVFESNDLPGNNIPSEQSCQTHDEPFATYMPSEYVHGMANGDKFDARRMELSSKTFETALSSMLDKEETVRYSEEYYNQFARSGKRKHGSPSRKQTSNKHGHVHTSNTDDATKMLMAWGPEAKGSSVGAKLAMFLEDICSSPDTRTTGNHAKSSSKSNSSDRFTSRLEQFQSSPVQNVSSSRQKIKALPDTERESAYMSKAETERHRIAKIRKARQAAEVIQKAWRQHHQK